MKKWVGNMSKVKRIVVLLLINLLLCGCTDEAVEEAKATLNSMVEVTYKIEKENIFGRELESELYGFVFKDISSEKIELFEEKYNLLSPHQQTKIKNAEYLWTIKKAVSIYEALKPYADMYGLSDFTCTEYSKGISSGNSGAHGITFQSEYFDRLSNEDKLLFLSEISLEQVEDKTFPDHYISITMTSKGHKYWSGEYKKDGQHYSLLFIDTNVENENTLKMITKVSQYWAEKERQGNKNNGLSCPNCGGLGYVKFYYGSSALEAFLNGEPDYTLGKCPLCHGTGKTNN